MAAYELLLNSQARPKLLISEQQADDVNVFLANRDEGVLHLQLRNDGGKVNSVAIARQHVIGVFGYNKDDSNFHTALLSYPAPAKLRVFLTNGQMLAGCALKGSITSSTFQFEQLDGAIGPLNISDVARVDVVEL